MTRDTPPNPALLPPGMRDLLPPEAETEAAAVGALMAAFASHGYQRVKPPLLEFEDSLLAGTGAAVSEQTFRLLDPGSRRMMGLRADMTPQVARIAATRMAGSPRPLRLSYAGQCLLVRGSQPAPDRQVAQAGIELIGVDAPEADAEMVVVGAEALAAMGLRRVSFDLTLPPLAPALLDAGDVSGPARDALVHALDRKDAASVARHGGALAGLLTELLHVAGPVGPALDGLSRLRLPPAAAVLCDRFAATVASIQARAPELNLTLDPIEFRGFGYHTGICVTVFAPGRPEELGRGGRYVCGGGEPATGLTLYPDAVLRACPSRPSPVKVFVPWGANAADAVGLRSRGYATLSALSPTSDAAVEARRLGCTHLMRGGAAVPLSAEF